MSKVSDLKSFLDVLDKRLNFSSYRRRGLLYWSECDELWREVAFQASRDSEAGVLKFTINVGLASKRILLSEGESGRKAPDIWSCHLRERVGFLLPEHQDIWYSYDVRDGVQFNATINMVVEHLSQFVFPYLNSFDCDADILKLWLGGVSPGLNKYMREKYIKVVGG